MISVPVLRRNKAQQHCSSPRQLSCCKSQSSERRIHQQVQRETSTSVSRQQSNAHRTVGPHLYNPPPSQLTSTDPCTGSGTPALHPLPPSQAGANQRTPTIQSSTAHKQPAAGGHKHPAYGIQTAPIPAVPRPDSKRGLSARGSSAHHFPRRLHLLKQAHHPRHEGQPMHIRSRPIRRKTTTIVIAMVYMSPRFTV